MLLQKVYWVLGIGRDSHSLSQKHTGMIDSIMHQIRHLEMVALSMCLLETITGNQECPDTLYQFPVSLLDELRQRKKKPTTLGIKETVPAGSVETRCLLYFGPFHSACHLASAAVASCCFFSPLLLSSVCWPGNLPSPLCCLLRHLSRWATGDGGKEEEQQPYYLLTLSFWVAVRNWAQPRLLTCAQTPTNSWTTDHQTNAR